MSEQDFVLPGEPPETRVVTRWRMHVFPLTADLPWFQLLGAAMADTAFENGFNGVPLDHSEHGADYRRGASGPIGQYWHDRLVEVRDGAALPAEIATAADSAGFDAEQLAQKIRDVPLAIFDAERPVPESMVWSEIIAGLGCTIAGADP